MMPLYYLHVCNGTGFVEDQEGHELPDLAAAQREAVKGLRDILAADLKEGEIKMTSFIEVEDEARTLLITVTAEEVIKFTR